jgi:hypothetical protein
MAKIHLKDLDKYSNEEFDREGVVDVLRGSFKLKESSI